MEDACCWQDQNLFLVALIAFDFGVCVVRELLLLAFEAMFGHKKSTANLSSMQVQLWDRPL